MGAETKIEWCHHTFNSWRGCEKISPGCAHCYAEPISKRNPKVLGEWGRNGKRVIAAESAWEEPLKWNRAAEKAGERRRVFCASLADVFERRPELSEQRVRLFELTRATPALDWLLLSKRPENFYWMLPWLNPKDIERGRPFANVWLGVSVEDQQRANERISRLLSVPAAVHFLSMEPLLEAVCLRSLRLSPRCECGGQPLCDALSRVERCDCTDEAAEPLAWHHLDWVIVGGESGPKARACHLDWVRSILHQCQAENVPCFVKQLGSQPYTLLADVPARLFTVDRKGGDPSEWPDDLRVREFPTRCKLIPQP